MRKLKLHCAASRVKKNKTPMGNTHGKHRPSQLQTLFKQPTRLGFFLVFLCRMRDAARLCSADNQLPSQSTDGVSSASSRPLSISSAGSSGARGRKRRMRRGRRKTRLHVHDLLLLLLLQTQRHSDNSTGQIAVQTERDDFLFHFILHPPHTSSSLLLLH